MTEYASDHGEIECTPKLVKHWAECVRLLATRIIEFEHLRTDLAVILDWYEQLPNDELPPEHVRQAFGSINRTIGVPSK